MTPSTSGWPANVHPCSSTPANSPASDPDVPTDLAPAPSDDDGITGFTFEDLAGADAEDAIAALVMTALAVTGPSEWRRAVKLLHRAGERLRQRPFEHFMTSRDVHTGTETVTVGGTPEEFGFVIDTGPNDRRIPPSLPADAPPTGDSPGALSPTSPSDPPAATNVVDLRARLVEGDQARARRDMVGGVTSSYVAAMGIYGLAAYEYLSELPVDSLERRRLEREIGDRARRVATELDRTGR